MLPHVHMTTFSETIYTVVSTVSILHCIIMMVRLCRAVTDVNAKQVRVRQAAQELTEQ